MVAFDFLDRNDYAKRAPELFSILHGNMHHIAPTGNAYEVDYAIWQSAVSTAISEEKCIIILMQLNGKLAGYFQYSVRGDVFLMEEIEILPEYQGKHGLLRGALGFAVNKLPEGVLFAEAYANKNNAKSIAILEKMGLEIVGENKSGRSHHFRGSYRDLKNWIRRV